MSRAGHNAAAGRGDAGFTLIEVLAVMALVAMIVAAVSGVYRNSSGKLEVRTATLTMASRLRDLRSAAIASGAERVATIDVDRRVVRFGERGTPLTLGRAVSLSVTGAESETRSATTTGVRFFPNGSSTGATIKLSSERQAYEVRVNWLTGRVSSRALD